MHKKRLMVRTGVGLWGGAVLALSVTCVSIKTFPSSTDTYAPVPQDSVLVFFDAADIKVPYKVIGEVLAEGSSGWGKNQNDLVKKAQQAAGKMGANGILVEAAEKATGSERTMAALFGTKDNKRRVRALRLESGTVRTENAVSEASVQIATRQTATVTANAPIYVGATVSPIVDPENWTVE